MINRWGSSAILAELKLRGTTATFTPVRAAPIPRYSAMLPYPSSILKNAATVRSMQKPLRVACPNS